MTNVREYCSIELQGDLHKRIAAVSSFGKKEGGENLLIKPPKGGGLMTLTYGEILQTIGVIIAIAGLCINAIKVHNDIKKK